MVSVVLALVGCETARERDCTKIKNAIAGGIPVKTIRETIEFEDPEVNRALLASGDASGWTTYQPLTVNTNTTPTIKELCKL